MSSKFISAIVAFFLALPVMAEEAWDVTSVFLRLPQGQSTWTYLLPQARFLSPFRITYEQSPYCRGSKFQARVRYKGTAEFTAATLKNDLFYTSDKLVDGLEITFIQNNIQVQECEINVQSLSPNAGTTPPVPPPPPNKPVRAYAGLLEHNGGFISLKPIQFESTYYARDIELVIPDYCQGYEIQDLGYRLNGTYIPAERVRSKTILFRLPQLYYLTRIEVSILAPLGQTCQIPIYVYYQP